MAFKFKKIRKKIQSPVEITAVYLLMFFVKCMTLKGARRFGNFLGFFAYNIPSIKKIIKANLKIAFPDLPKVRSAQIGKRSMGSLFNVFIEFIWFKGRESRISNYIAWNEKSLEAFKQKRLENKDKKPCILLTMHMGNWEVTAQSHHLISEEELTSVARRIKNPTLERLMYEGRTATGAKIAHQKGAVKALVNSLRNKQSIGLLVDQNTKIHQGGIYGDFFGLPATVSRSPATFAKKFDPDIFMIECYRTDRGFFIDYKELPFTFSDCNSEDDFSQKLLKYMESLVTNRPEQWIWNYTRWGLCPDPKLRSKYPFYSTIDNKA